MNIVFYSLIKLLALLPMSILTYFGSFISFIIRLSNYRKKVILGNLSNSFPENSRSQNQQLLKKYYQYLGQLIAETIKIFSISKNTLKNRFVFKNKQLVQSYLDKNKDVILVLGHYGNWEWSLLATSINFSNELIGIYKPLSSSFWNNKIKQIRSQFGATLVDMNESVRYILQPNSKARIIGVIADQTPSSEQLNYWTIFLNQKTPVFLGTVKLAKKLDCAVIYANIIPIKNGFYEFSFELITDKPSTLKAGEITTLHTRILEQKIIERPFYWLWSHRRWKHKQK